MPDPSRMYPSMPEGAQSGAESRPEPQDSSAARMYPSVAEAASHRRAATPEERMYPSMQESAPDQRQGYHSEHGQDRTPTGDTAEEGTVLIDPAEFDGLDLPDGAVDAFVDLSIDRAGYERLQGLQEQYSTQYWDRQLTAWQSEIMAEPNADRMMADAQIIMDAYGDEDLSSQLGAYASHPGLIRLLSRIRHQLQQR